VITDPLIILLLGILVVVGGIIGLRLHAFLALLLGAFLVALLTPEMAIEAYGLSKGMTDEAAAKMAQSALGARIATAFGSTCGKIGILIAMAAIIGKCLLESGAAEKIVRSTLSVTGEERAPISFLGSSFFLAIPVFFDTVFYLMIPLAKAMAMRLKKNYLMLVLMIAAGAAMANSLVPPTPGPLFLIGEMDIPIGMMMAGGFIVGLFTIVVGYIFAAWANKKWPVPLRDSLDAPLEEIRKLSQRSDAELPGLLWSMLPIVLPVLLITGRAALDTMGASQTSMLYGFFDFFGEKNLALIIGALVALILLVRQKVGDSKTLTKSVQDAL